MPSSACDAAIQRLNRRATQETIQEGQLLEIPASAGTAEHAYILPGQPCPVHGPKGSFRPVRKYLNQKPPPEGGRPRFDGHIEPSQVA